MDRMGGVAGTAGALGGKRCVGTRGGGEGMLGMGKAWTMERGLGR